MGALDALAAATKRFADARSELDAALQEVPTVDHPDRHAVGTLCADVQNVCTYVVPVVVRDQLRLTQLEAAILEAMPRPPDIELAGPGQAPEAWLRRWAEATTRWIEEEGHERQAKYWEQLESLHDEDAAVYARFVLGFKQAYFSIRALQDVLYRVAITILDGNRPGAHASMKRVLQDGNPVRELLRSDADVYLAWFVRWRNLRDSIKLGRSTSIAGPGALDADADPDNYGLALTQVGPDGGVVVRIGADATHVSDVADALRYTSVLMERIADAAKTNA